LTSPFPIQYFSGSFVSSLNFHNLCFENSNLLFTPYYGMLGKALFEKKKKIPSMFFFKNKSNFIQIFLILYIEIRLINYSLISFKKNRTSKHSIILRAHINCGHDFLFFNDVACDLRLYMQMILITNIRYSHTFYIYNILYIKGFVILLDLHLNNRTF